MPHHTQIHGRLRLAAAALVFFLGAPRCYSSPVDLDASLVRLVVAASETHTARVVDAISASPKLSAMVTRLASAGQLTGIAVLPDSSVGIHYGRAVQAGIEQRQIRISAALLDSLSRPAGKEVSGAGTKLRPNSVTFVIGHLVAHLLGAPELSRQLADLTRQFDGGTQRPLTANDYVHRRSELTLSAEATAFIHSWNFMIDAATAAEGAALTAKQIVELLIGLEYRSLFWGALENPQARVRVSPGGFIENDAANVRLVVETLRKLPPYNIE